MPPLLAAFALFLVPAAAQTKNVVVAGKLVVEAPTLTAIGLEWKIAGDENANARVDVSYRRKGDTAWRTALPMLRIHHEIINGGSPPFEVTGVTADNKSGNRENPWHYDTGNMFAGSVLGLAPDTDYECRLVLADPDGVSGEREKIVTVHTRKEPQPAAGGKVYHVYPWTWQGPKQQPAFLGLLRAYYMGASSSDHGGTFPARVKPGDTILVHAGTYQSDRYHYLNGLPRAGYNAYASVIDGTYYLTASGTPDKPIVIKAAGDGEVIFDGAGNGNLFNLLRGSYNYFEGITVRNTNIAFLLGWKDIAGSDGFTLKHSKIYDVARAVQAEWSASRDIYIGDNVMIGRHDPAKMMGWSGKVWSQLPGFPELLVSEYAVKVYGQGHVVAHNYFANWHDAVDISTYGEPDGTPDMADQKVSGPTELDDHVGASIDFYGNDIFNMGDNCIEADGGVHNLRVFDNRCVNAAQAALSAQPIFGGPVYFYRNLVYNAIQGGPLKYADGPSGVLVYQNTFIGGDTAPGGPVGNMHVANNLFLGRGGSAPVYAINTVTNYSTSDYNGFAANSGAVNFAWNSPPDGVAADFDYDHKLTRRDFGTLKSYSGATGQDRHSIMVDYDVFQNVPRPDDSDPQRLYNPENMDFRLKPKSIAVDAGMVLATINDGYSGRAPDLGAFELGAALPDYGPRDWPGGSVATGKVEFRSWTGPARKGASLLSR